MANKLYIFGIGGTGSRVIKALTMLLAAVFALVDAASKPDRLVVIPFNMTSE